jgi:hypothetical protein
VRVHAAQESSRFAGPSDRSGKPLVENGDRSSVANTHSLFSASRLSLRNAHNSSPFNEWTLGAPFLTRRTCKRTSQVNEFGRAQPAL